MLIILEGVDGAGKTTLARQLERALLALRPGDTVEILHRGPPTVHPLDEYEVPLHTYRPGTTRHLICDRWHQGEQVYPDVLGRPTLLTAEATDHIELFLRARGALLVHVDDSLAVLQNRLQTRGDDLVAVSDLRDLQSRYYQVMSQTQLRVSGSIAVDELLAQAVTQDVVHRPLGDFVTYVGPRYPELLLLGDVRNADRDQPSPAFTPYPSTSGAYLLRALRACHADLGKIGIANACDVDNVQRLVSTLAGPLVVPLGRHASRHCERHGISVAWEASHPQYARRFHFADLHSYGREVLGKWS